MIWECVSYFAQHSRLVANDLTIPHTPEFTTMAGTKDAHQTY